MKLSDVAASCRVLHMFSTFSTYGAVHTERAELAHCPHGVLARLRIPLPGIGIYVNSCIADKALSSTSMPT